MIDLPYIAEVAAALEGVEGVRATTIQVFGLYDPDGDGVMAEAETDGAPSAYTPFTDQVVAIAPERVSVDISITVEAFG